MFDASDPGSQHSASEIEEIPEMISTAAMYLRRGRTGNGESHRTTGVAGEHVRSRSRWRYY